MELTEKVKLNIKGKDALIIVEMEKEYIRLVNELVKKHLDEEDNIFKYTTRMIKGNILPKTCVNNAIRDARSIVKTYRRKARKYLWQINNSNKQQRRKIKEPNVPILKKPICKWTNQQYEIENGCLIFPIKPVINHKSTPRMRIGLDLNERQKFLNNLAKREKGLLRITQKGKKLVAQITYDKQEPQIKKSGKVMGIDLGIKCPSVSFCDGRIRFYGNGRKNKYLRRHFEYIGKMKMKSKNKITFSGKEQRVMQDIDHKISRQIINEAIKENVKTIKMEKLKNILKTTCTSRKNKKSLHSWSFGRLQSYIEYKAKLVGIQVEYVNPQYTSQICPHCGKKNHAQDREYVCECGYKQHRDVVGAINIANGTTLVNGRVKSKFTSPKT